MTATQETKRPNIRINNEDLQSIQSMLDTAQGRAHADILTANDIVGFARDAEKALEVAGIAATFRKGALYRVTPSGPVANAYKYSRTGTAVLLERRRSGWALIAISRISVWPRAQGSETLTMTIDQKLRALHRFMKNFDISKPDIALVLGFTPEVAHSHE